MEASDTVPWKALHPASVAVNLIPTAWRAVRSFWPLLIALIVGGQARGQATFDLGLLALFLLFPVWRTILHWLTLRYRVSEGRLEIQTGLLNRQLRVIPPDRIQNVELVRNVFHRVSGLVELKVETASGTDIEGQLSALSVDEAQALMASLTELRQKRAPTEEADQVVLVENDLGDLVRYGLSQARLGLAVVALGVIYEVFLATDPTQAGRAATVLTATGTFALLVLLVTGAWIAGAALAVVRHYGFTLRKTADGDLTSEEGLFTKRRVVLSERKIQLVNLQQTLIRRALGFQSLHLETAAAREEAGGTATAEAVVPVLAEHAVQGALDATLPAPPQLSELAYTPPHPKAVLRAMLGGTWGSLLLSVGATWLLWPWGSIALLLVPFALFDIWFDHRHQGWWVGDRYVVARRGWWRRTVHILARHRIQSIELLQGPIARRWDLAQLRVRVAGSSIRLPDMAFDEALELELELSETLPSVVALATEPGGVAVLLDDHEERHRDDAPGDAGKQEQQAEREEQQPAPRPPVSPVGQASHDADRPEHQPYGGLDHPEPGRGRGGVVEGVLPEPVEPRLEPDQHPIEEQQAPEGDVQGRDDESFH